MGARLATAIPGPTVMDAIKDLLGIVGGLLGAIAFFWKLWDTFSAYVRIDVEVERPGKGDDGAPTIVATVENQGFVPKRVDYATLVIAPERTGLEAAAAALRPHLGAEGTDGADGASPLAALFGRRVREPVYAPDGRFALLPLPFFYEEQRQVGNERVRARSSVATERLRSGESFAVVLVVFLRYPLGLVRVRVTSDLLRTDRTGGA